MLESIDSLTSLVSYSFKAGPDKQGAANVVSLNTALATLAGFNRC